MLKSSILHALVEPFPNRVLALNSILESAGEKDLCAAFELIVDCVLSPDATLSTRFNGDYDANNNPVSATQQAHYRLAWPLKVCNRHHGLEYDCMFSFLSTGSLLWHTLFRLEHVHTTFTVDCSIVTPSLAYRIKNGISSLSGRYDSAYNVLNLRPLQFFMLKFLILLHDTSTTSNLTMNGADLEADSVFADLLLDYLNFFLPVNERNTNFPRFASSLVPNDTKTKTSTLNHHQRPSLLKRVVLKSPPLQSTDGAMGSEQAQLNSADRIRDMEKINIFLHLLTECLALSFVPPQPATYDGDQPVKLAPTARLLAKIPPLSPQSLSDPQQFLASLEVIFVLGMVLRHAHLFTNAFASTNPLVQNINSHSDLTEGQEVPVSKTTQFETPVDELRTVLFKAYLHAPIYKFLVFHVQHWPLTHNIKWIVELWLTYIQTWRFVAGTISDPLATSVNYPTNLMLNFIIENYLVYVDIYQFILRRYCILDLTNREYLELLHRILSIFDDLLPGIKSIDNRYASAQCEYLKEREMNFRVATVHAQLLSERDRHIMRLFVNCDKPIESFNPLFGTETCKLATKLFDIITNDRDTIHSYLATQAATRQHLIYSFIKSMCTEEPCPQYGNLSRDDLNKLTFRMDDCLKLLDNLHGISARQAFTSSSQAANSFQRSFLAGQLDKTRKYTLLDNEDSLYIPPSVSDGTDSDSESSSATPDSEMSRNGFTLQLSPKGRFQLINRLRKPSISSYFDPKTAPVREFENRFLVYTLGRISDIINQQFGEHFDRLYRRNDLVGRVARKFLYGDEDLKSRLQHQPKHHPIVNMNSTSEQTMCPDVDDDLSGITLRWQQPPRLHLRAMADYRFLVYMIIMLFVVKLCTGWPFGSSLILLGIIYLSIMTMK